MSLRALTEDDLELILPWRNSPAVRRAMFHHHEISLDEHRAWFRGLQNDLCRRWYIFEDQQLMPQGVVYFTYINSAERTAFWGFYARPGAPMGTGFAMAVDALDKAFVEFGLHKLCGEVLASNSVVVGLNKLFGFKQEGRFVEQHHNGDHRVDIIRFGMMAGDWPEHKRRLEAKAQQLRGLKTSAGME